MTMRRRMITSVHINGKRSVADDASHGNSPFVGVYPIGFIPARSFFLPKRRNRPAVLATERSSSIGSVHYANSSWTGLPVSMILIGRHRVLMFSLRGLILSA